MRPKQSSLWIAWLALLASPALAVDGVREINQVCAETTGCFTGDTPGLPVTITQPGSYRLTGNLLLSNANANAISVATANVSIDLNGFAIRGVTDCATGPGCSNLGTGRGVAADSTFIYGLSVRNGSVYGMGAVGVYVGEHGHVEDVRAISNGTFGIFVDAFSEVVGCNAARNGGGGILADSGSLVADNVVAITRGTSPGISTGSNVVVRGNVVEGAGGDGIAVGSASLVTGNTVTFSKDDGIEAGAQSRLIGNVLYFNDSAGIRFIGSPAGYSDNTINLGFGSQTVVGGTDLGGNHCEASTSCP